jgi:anti-anti-sigma factor
MSEVKWEKEGDTVRIRLIGDIGVKIDHLMTIQDRVDLLTINPPEHVIFDLKEVNMLTSSGLSLIMRAYKRSERKGRRFEIVNAPPDILNIFRMTGLLNVLQVSPLLDE